MPSEETPAEPDFPPAWLARARSLVTAPRFWARALLRSAVVSLLPALYALDRGSYAAAIPTLLAVAGLMAVMTFAEGLLLARSQRLGFLKTAAGLIFLAWATLCAGLVEYSYATAVLSTGDVDAGGAALVELAASLSDLGPRSSGMIVVVFFQLAGAAGLASTLHVNGSEGVGLEVTFLVSGHAVLFALFSSFHLQGGNLLVSLICPWILTVGLTPLLFVVYQGVELAVTPDDSRRVSRERLRQERRERFHGNPSPPQNEEPRGLG